MNTLAMKPSIRFETPRGAMFWRLRHPRGVMPDLAGIARQPEHDRRTHSRATLEWVCRAQDACCNPNDNGLAAAGFDFGKGWLIDTLNAKHFSDAPMIDMAGVAIPSCRGR